MATLLDERLEEQEQPEEEETASEDVFSQEPIQQDTQDEIPDKYKGKSAEELVRMHQEAEKLLGRQSSEVGELRQVVDSYIQTQLSQQQAPNQQQDETVDEVDFFSDPETAVKRAIENHPKIKEAEAVSNEYKKTNALTQLQSNHPDMKEILQDTNFSEWIKASKIRTQLFMQADKQFDYEAANELFSLWKERRDVVQKTATLEKQERKQAVKKASTGSATGSSEKVTRKIYRRADIIKLMRTDPERYQSLSEEIMKAYQEGRVRN